MRYYQLFETTSHTYTVYHGTSVEFNGFQPRFRGSAHGTAPINMEGFNFTDSAECAATFGAIVLKCEVTITRPFVIDAKGQNYSQFKHILNDKLSRISRAKYDGIIIKRFADAGIHGDEYIESNHYIPFSEDQIRIIGEELTEAPIAIHHIDSETDTSSFQRDDHIITRAPKPVEKIKKIWSTSVVDLELYLYDRGLDMSKTLRVAQYAQKVPSPKSASAQTRMERERSNSYVDDMEAMVASIVPNPNAITVILTNNEGAKRLPLTGWMIAHRLCHAMEVTKSTNFGEQVQGLKALIKTSFRAMADDIEDIFHRTNIPIYQTACLIGSTKACRDFNLNGASELYPECFAQYLLTGKVKLRRLSLTQEAGGETYKIDPRKIVYINDDIAHRETKMNIQFAQIIEMSKGHIFTL